jgi:hypothetical protein
MAILDDKTKATIKQAVKEIISDASINTQVTYRQHKITTFDPESQSIGSARWTDYKPVDAIKTYFSDFEMFVSGGAIQKGDVRYIIYKDDLNASTPSPSDLIIETYNQPSGVTYGVEKVGWDSVGVAYVFHCRRP